MRRAYLTLLVIGILLNAAVFLAASNEVNRVRSDFCAWAAVHVAENTHSTRAQRADLASDQQLEQRLGCG